MNKNNKPIIAAIIIVALLIIIGAVFASGILAHDDDEQAAYEVNFIDGEQVIKTITVKENHLVTRINDPVKDGYIFAGWYTDQELTNEFTFDDTYITNDLTLYAKWVKASEPEPGDITYTVTFNTNGANSISPQIVKAGDKAVKPADPLKSGYKFVGWYSDSSFTTLFDFQSPITFDITLYAKFTSTGGGGGGSVTPPVTDTKFTVTYNGNGNTAGTVPDVQTLSENTSIQVLDGSSLEKSGHSFVGWNTKADGTGTNYAVNDTISFEDISNDLTLYAKWALGNYTVDENNSSKVTVDITDKQIEEIITSSAEDTVTLIDASAMNDVTSVSVKTTTLQTAADSANNKDIVISLPNASLKLSSTVVDNLISANQDETNIVFTATPVDEDPDVMGSIPENVVLEGRPVYEFEITVGGESQTTFKDPIVISIPYQLQEGEDPQHIDVYYLKADNTITSESGKYNSETACVDVTLAHLSKFIIVNKAKFTVTFDSQGGSAVPPETNVNYNSKIKEPLAPTKTGYTFAGWHTADGQEWIFSDNPSQADRVKSDMTLYAHWNLTDYKITYHLDGQQSSQTPATYTVNKAVTLPTPVKAGHTFSGWYDNPGLKGTPITTIAEGSTGDITLYAKFQQITYTVTLPADNDAYTITPSGPHTVNEGASFTFTIKLAEEYVNSDIIVKANGAVLSGVLSGSEGRYTLKSVSENITIAIEGIVKTKYSITLPQEAEGYSIEVSSTSVDPGSDATLSFNLADGYDQSKYIIKVNGEAVSLNNNAYTIKNIESDMVITVEGVEKNTYVVTFNSNGGSAVTAQNVSYDDKASEPTEPTKTGYTFAAWYADADLKMPYDFTSSVTEDITLYAKWTAASADYIVNHWQEKVDSKNANDTKNYTLVSSELITTGITDSSVEITSLLYGGFTYQADISDSSGKIAADGSTVFNLYYIRNSYTITYSDSSEPATLKFGAAITPYQPLKEGYSFIAWYEDQDWNTLFKDVTMPPKNITLYAKWNANKYAIIFESNGGSAVEKITANYGTIITEPTAPTKTGYTFKGWFKDAEFTQAWDFAADTVPVNGTTLYAKWDLNSYKLTINYVYEDGSSASESYIEDLDYNSSYSVESPEVVGHLPDLNVVSGTLTKDTTITVTYGAYVASVGEKNYRTLEDALNNAVAGDKVILLKDYTLKKDVTVPKSVFLVLPCAADDEGYDLTANYEKVHNPDGTSTSREDLSVLYCTLTIPSDVTLNVEGQVLVNAVTGRPAAGHYDMDITGGYAQIQLEGNIIVQDGAILEVCGYIKGNGQVTAENGSEVRDLYVVRNWRGGSQAFEIFPDIYPFNEYDCHNIQSTIYLNSGASLFGNVKMYASGDYHYTRFPQVDGSNGMIRLNDGAHLVKSYDVELQNGSSPSDIGRTLIEIYGGATFSHSTLLIVGMNLSTKSFIYPIDGDISFGLHDGEYVIENSFKALTGVEVTLYENASLTLIATHKEGVEYPEDVENTLILYDEFNDADNTSTTEYPIRPAATLRLMDNSTFNIYGNFAGTICFDGVLGNAIVNAKDALSLEIDTIEANGYLPNVTDGRPKFVNLHFKTKYQYTISFNSNGGSEQSPIKYIAGDEVELPTPERLGYDFQGWYLDTALTQLCNPDDITSGNITLYAKWDLSKYTVSFVSNGGSSVADQTINHNEAAEKPNDPTRSGFKFIAWYADQELTEAYDFTTPITGKTILYAKWEVIEYTISFVTNNEETLDAVKYTTADNSLTIKELSKTGYDFQGWYLDEDLTSPFTFKQYETVGNLTLYAKWSPTAYTIKYYDKTQQLNLAPNGYSIEETVTLPTPEKTGYVFAGWHEKQDLSDEAVFTISEGTSGNKSYYASWTAEPFAITYFDGSNTLSLSPNTYTILENVVLPTPAKDGYTFGGWYNNADCTGNKITSIPIGSSGAKVFYAKFTVNQYTISFNSNGGSAVGNITADYSTNIDEPTAPAKTGYNFAGWFKDVDLTQAWDFAADTVPVNGTTLYAKWTLEIYTIDFYNDRELVKSVEYSVESDSIEMPEIPQEGYTFDGWLTKDSVDFKYVKGTTVGDFDLYAKFIINQYTISFNNNGGSVVKNITADYGTSITKPDDPTRTGYTFAGWFRDADCLTAWNFEVDTVPADDITLHAKWIANSYTVVFHANNGTDATTSQNFKYDEAQNLTVNTFTKEGYTFQGWSESSSGVVVKYADKISVTNLTADDNGTINLYAVWSAQIFSVIYNNNGGEGSIENTSATYDSTVVLNNGANFSKEGHSLTAWNTMTDGSGIEYALDYKFEPWKLTNNLTLYAQWTVNSSTISFNSNGGSAVEDITANYGTDVTEPTAPEKEGHTFVGWYTDEALENKYTFTTMPAESITLYAKWTVNQYTVTYYVDGGKYQSYDIEYGETVTKPADPTKTGYTFKDWDVEIPATMPAENLTFNAVFEINQYTITYWIDNEKVETQTYDFGATITAYQPASTDGKTFSGWSPELPKTMPDYNMTVSGSFNANTYTITYYVDEKQYDTPQSVEFGETITPMDRPTKEGYTFSGWVWYKVEGGSETKLDTAPATMPAYHLVVRGSFTINTYEVTFHPNNVDKDSTVPVDYGSLIKEPSVSAKKGYTLEGWYTDALLTNKWDFTTNTMPAENIDLYAKWTLDTYTIRFYNGNELVTSIEYTIETESIEIPDFSQEGYTFSGWWFKTGSSSAFFYSPGVTVGNIDVYAKLEINHYTITFDSNGGSDGGHITQDYDTPLGPLPTPTYDGYKFMGWFEDNGTFSKEFTATTMPAGEITLYAKWEAISYSITYVLNDGTNDPTNPDSYTVETEITLHDATKEGYTFDGWYSDKKLTELVSQIPTGTPGNLTLYAKFTPNKYTVIFNANGGTGTMETQEFTYDEAQNLTVNTFIKEGHTFQGWSESSSGGVKYADNVSVTNLTADNNGTINLYAVWEINEYTISFNSNGGSAVGNITADYSTNIDEPTAPAKTGYNFAGWYTDEALKNEYTFMTMPAESITLYAKWTANQYTITFNSNGGTEVAAINADYGTNITKPDDPNKKGYTFDGWFKDVGLTQAWDFAIDTVPVNGTTLYAQWTAKEYTITFNSNGAGAIGEIHYTIGATIELQTPVKTGYTFIGWYDGAQEFTYVAGTTIGDYNLTAHWEATNYEIIYKDGEKTISGLQPASYTYEAAKTLATNATKEGYTFSGWYETIDCMGAPVTEIPAQSVGDKTFYAKFTPNKYTVIFNANGGTGTMEDQEFTYDVAQNLAPNTFTKYGYDFQGWSNPDTEANYTNTQNVTNLVPSGSITLYAVWVPTSYSISYNLNGGSVSSDNPLNYTIESDKITLTNPTQVGYTFAGWIGTDLAKAQKTVEIAKGSIGNREYIANWTANTYTVHFEGNGATSGSINDQKFVYGEEQALTENSFVKDGHTFVGWSETAEGSKKYDNQQTVVNLTSTNGGKVTLYAVWSINYYQVTLPNNELAGVTYTVEVADGYDSSSIAYGGDFKFTITFSDSLGSNNPVIVFGDSNINASSSTGNTYNFTIPAVTSDLQLSVSLVNNTTAALERLVNNDASVDYHLSLSGTTLTVSIINPKVDAADLISKISEATGGQTIAANSNSGRTDAASTFLAYLPNDNTLWADNLAEYAVELSGYRIIFKQDSEAIEEAKLTYFLQIEQLCRLARDDLSSAILSAYIGMENDEKYFKVISKNDNKTFYDGLVANFSVPFALVGHPDAVYGCYTMDQSFTTAKVRIGIDRAINDQYNLYRDAIDLLKNMDVPITSMSGNISQAFMDDGTGYGGYGQYYCTSSETGIRYTDVYHLSFDHYDVSKYGHHSLVVDNTLSGVTTKHLGYGPNESLDDNLIFEDQNSLSPDWFNNTFKDPLLRWYVYVAVSNSISVMPTLNADYANEHTHLAAGELVVIDFDQNSRYTMNDLTVTSTAGEIIWISNNSFIMPNGDVTISSK